MPLNLEELLKPIPGDNPSGVDLRYEPVYEKIKEARREDDEAPQGEWARERKTAEWPVVIKLTTEAITNKSKDVQLAAWLTEAMLKREGFTGFRSGLELIRGLLESFWDTLYPEIEDGDPEMRAAPLSWLGLKLDTAVKGVPLVRGGHDFFKYNESQTLVGYEAACEGDKKKLAARQKLIDEEGKLSAEAWDKAFDETTKPAIKQLAADLAASLELVSAINEIGAEKFGDVAPSYGGLRKALEEVQYVVSALLKKKLAVDPDPVEEAQPEAGAAATAEGGAPVAGAAAVASAAAGPLTPEPVSREDALGRVVAAARFLRRNEPANPASYLMLRGLRWGEVRASNGHIEPRLLDAPTTALRTQLKSLLLDGKWAPLLEACETAMGQPCGRGWLDLQRYVITACSRLGKDYYSLEMALRDALRGYVADVPKIVEITMMDDTPTANGETQEWIAAEIAPDGNAAKELSESEAGGEGKVDENNAMELARAGRTEEAIMLLSRQLAQERSLRGRFRRRTQLAAVLVEAGQEAIAQPILEDLIQQIENYKLEEWESGEMVAEPLALLYRVLFKLEGDIDTRQGLYLRICKLDPIQALRCPQAPPQ
jgi:type VI secretion system protein ImpA